MLQPSSGYPKKEGPYYAENKKIRSEPADNRQKTSTEKIAEEVLAVSQITGKSSANEELLKRTWQSPANIQNLRSCAKKILCKIFLFTLQRADVNAVNKDGQTHLHIASHQGKMEMVVALIEKGADVNAVDKNGCTPLHLASGEGKRETVLALIEKGADVEAVDKDGDTPLHFASVQVNMETVLALIEKGADLKAVDKNGNTPLHIASQQGKMETVLALIEKGADLKAVDKNGNTPLHKASFQGKRETVLALIEKGADLKAVDKNGNTPLHKASHQGKMETVVALIEKGADVKAVNKKGQTPLHFASSEGKMETVVALIEKGADFKAVDAEGWTPFFACLNINSIQKCINYFGNPSDYDKKLWTIKLLSHSWELKGSVNSLGNKIPLEGGLRKFCADKIHHFYEEFTKQYPHLFSVEEIQKFSHALKNTLTGNDDALENRRVGFMNGEPIIVATGFIGHAVYALFYKDYLFVANKGGETRKPIEAYHLSREKVTKESLEEIINLKKKDEAAYKTWLETIPARFDATQDLLSALIENAYPLERVQRVGNCSWESLETLIHALLIFDRIKDGSNLSLSQDEICKNTSETFKQFLRFMQLKTLEEYINSLEEEPCDSHLIQQIVEGLSTRIEWEGLEPQRQKVIELLTPHLSVTDRITLTVPRILLRLIKTIRDFRPCKKLGESMLMLPVHLLQ